MSLVEKLRKDEIEENTARFRKNSHRFAVIKISGSFNKEQCLDYIGESLAYILQQELYPIVVCGAGEIIDHLMKEYGMEIVKKDGLRFTDKETLETIQEALHLFYKNIEESIKKYDGKTAIISPKAVSAVKKSNGLGYVGTMTNIEESCVASAVDKGFIPVIGCLGFENSTMLNINADEVANFLVQKIEPQKYIILTKQGGILDKDKNLIRRTTLQELYPLIQAGIVNGGMKLKVSELSKAVEHLYSIQITSPNHLLQELFTNFGNGSFIKGRYYQI